MEMFYLGPGFHYKIFSLGCLKWLWSIFPPSLSLQIGAQLLVYYIVAHLYVYNQEAGKWTYQNSHEIFAQFIESIIDNIFHCTYTTV